MVVPGLGVPAFCWLCSPSVGSPPKTYPVPAPGWELSPFWGCEPLGLPKPSCPLPGSPCAWEQGFSSALPCGDVGTRCCDPAGTW